MRRGFERAALWIWRQIAQAELRGGLLRALWCPLRALGVLFQFCGSWRFRLYELGLLRSERVSCYVVSVGNLSSGGTGKTPLCLLLAQTLSATLHVSILSRGYRGTLSRYGTRANDRLGPLFGARFIGDEPNLMARNIEVPIFIDADRVRGARSAVRECRPQALIIDDGFQHRRLQRQCELLLIDANALDPLALCLPAGPLRNHWNESKRAHLILLTGINSDQQWRTARQKLSKWSRAPVVGSQTRLEAVVPLPLWRCRQLVRQRPKATQVERFPRRAFACCALAHPERFLQTLNRAGIHVVGTTFLPDHAPWSEKERDAVLRRANRCGADAVICTEKDAVKWSPMPNDIEFFVAQTSVQLCYEKAQWRQFVQGLIQEIEDFDSPISLRDLS